MDYFYLYQALELAKIRRGHCSPNPSVGAVIVRDNTVLATGYHLAPYQPHAEIDALNQINHQAENATLYVSLEPCCHHGKTPPCTDAIIKSGVKNVVYGYRDPNPVVQGNGEKKLTEAGITCKHLSIPEINFFYKSYHHWHSTKTPFVTAKIAMSLDGKIAGKNNSRIKLTGEKLDEFTHYHRKNSDAILTTAKTIIHDNPKMNARFQNEIVAKHLYVLDSQLVTPISATIFDTAASITIFHKQNISIQKKELLTQVGANCIELVENSSGLLDLHAVLSVVGENGVHDLWIEAGGECFSSFVKQKLLQRAFIYIAPCVVSEGPQAFTSDFSNYMPLQNVQWQEMGNDVLCTIHW